MSLSKQQTPRATLRELSTSLVCKKIDIGTAILPKPLFVHETEDHKLPTATIDCVDNDDNDDNDKGIINNSTKGEADGSGLESTNETQYAKIVKSEFNAIVIEVREKVKHTIFCSTPMHF